MISDSPFDVLDQLPYYAPWIGGSYRTRQQMLSMNRSAQGGLWFTHVMGESHYSDDYEDTRDLTQRVVCDWAFTRSKGGRFFTGVCQAVQGRPATEVDRPAGWSDIAYSNFVQRMLPTSRLAPTDEQWDEARRCFLGQLSLTQPRVLLVLGERLWGNLPTRSFVRVPSLLIREDWGSVDDACMYGYWLRGQLKLTLAVHSYHPSSSKFDWRIAYQRMCTADMLYDNLLMALQEEHGTATPPPEAEPPTDRVSGFASWTIEERYQPS